MPLFGRIGTAQLPDYLMRLLAAQLAKAIRIHGPNDASGQIELANAVIESISSKGDDLAFLRNERIARSDGHDVLEELAATDKPSPRPLTERSASSLLTGAPGLPQLGHEIELELATADRCGMLVAFVKSGGMRLLRDVRLPPELQTVSLAEFRGPRTRFADAVVAHDHIHTLAAEEIQGEPATEAAVGDNADPRLAIRSGVWRADLQRDPWPAAGKGN